MYTLYFIWLILKFNFCSILYAYDLQHDITIYEQEHKSSSILCIWDNDGKAKTGEETKEEHKKMHQKLAEAKNKLIIITVSTGNLWFTSGMHS
jgi:hypothetical protein